MPKDLDISKTAALAFAVGLILVGKGIAQKINDGEKGDMYAIHGVGLIAMAGIGQHTKKIGMK